MKITFLGTSAGEEYPCIWCECENCAKARKWGGKNIRRNSSVILDNDVMIDMGKTAHIQAERFGINLREIKTLLVTHSHLDHFNTHTLWTRCAVSAETPLPLLNIFGSSQVYKTLLNNDRYNGENWRINFNIIEPFKKYYADDLEIFTLDGRHSDGEIHSINFIITRKNKTFLYMLDTGYPFDETLDAIKNYKYKFDFIITENTHGPGAGSNGHMGLDDNLRISDFFITNRLWKNEPNYYITHIAPFNCPPHDEYNPIVSETGKNIKLAYDGLVIDTEY